MSLTQRTSKSAFQVGTTGDDPVGNVTFSLLARKYEVEVPELVRGEGPSTYLERVGNALRGHGWEVRETCTLGIFSFATINMYHDLVRYGDAVVSHPVVRAICGDGAALARREGGLPLSVDDVRRRAPGLNPNEAFQVLDADSSQEEAIGLANAGYSFVLQGPPGTGKSQTITNIISEALAHHKTVLFVSEKRAALDVVHRRLEQAGLGDFVYVLHDVKQNKRDVLKGLAQQLQTPPRAASRVPDSTVRAYERSKAALDAYALESTSVDTPLGKSLWEVNDELLRLRDAPRVTFAMRDVPKLTGRGLDAMRDAVTSLADAQRQLPCAPIDHTWHGISAQHLTEDLVADVRSRSTRYAESATRLLGSLERIESECHVDFDMTLTAARTICELLQGFEGSREEVALLSSGTLTRTTRALARLTQAKKEHAGTLGRLRAAAPEPEMVESLVVAPAELRRFEEEISGWLRSDQDFARWEEMGVQRLEEESRDLTGRLDDIEQARAAILRDYRPSILELDCRALLLAFERDFSNPLRRLLSSDYQDACGQIDACRREVTSQRIGYGEALALLRQLQAIELRVESLEELNDTWQRDFPTLYQGVRTDPDKVRARIEAFHALKGLQDAAHAAARELDPLADDLTSVAKAFGLGTLGLEADLDRLVATARRVGARHKRALQSGIDERELQSLVRGVGRREAKALASQVRDVEERGTSFWSLFAEGDDAAQDDLRRAIDHAQRCSEGAGELGPMLAYARRRATCRELGLEGFVTAAERARLAPEALLPALERRVYTLWLEWALQGHAAVADFDPRAIDRQRDQFVSCDTQLIADSESQVLAVLRSSLRGLADTSDGRRLVRESQKRSHLMPIRKVFSEMPDLIAKLKPCMMMSPLSVSTFLESRSLTFDLVIFDEASQVCTENAVGAISRGRQVVIAGDSNQLPPTSFFVATSDGPDDLDDEDAETLTTARDADAFESVLEEAGMLHSVSLRWHYRSRNESLISFSNKKIYGGSLLTFPSSYEQRQGEGVSFVHVREGTWLGARRGNPTEARRVAELVFQHLRSFPDRSVGVIALSERQAALISDEIERLRQQPGAGALDHFFDEERTDCLFVKNLENVQGDERDSIFISVGYGPGESGKVLQNFGPINKKGGERRLNVAVTRARRDLVLVSSMLDTDVSESSTSRGVQVLHDYLAYARTCEAELTSQGSRSRAQREVLVSHVPEALDRSTILSTVERELVARGYHVERSIGTSSCRIDLGIKRGERDTDYIAGILFDGPEYASSTFTRERERILPGMLGLMGWRIHRVWVQAWRRDPEGSLRTLLDFVSKAAETEDGDGREGKVAPHVAPAPTGPVAPPAPVTAPKAPGTPGAQAGPGPSPSPSRQGAAASQPSVAPRATAGRASSQTPPAQSKSPATPRAAAAPKAPDGPTHAPARPSSQPKPATTTKVVPTRDRASGQASAKPAARTPKPAPKPAPKRVPLSAQTFASDKDLAKALGFAYYVEADRSRRQNRVEDFISLVVETEAPISFDLLCEDVMTYEASHQSEAAVKHEVSSYVEHSDRFKLDKYNFVWVSGKDLSRPRMAGRRSLQEISPTEREMGIMWTLWALNEGAGVSKDELLEKVSRAFGVWPWPNGRVPTQLRRSFSSLKSAGKLDELDGIVRP